MSSKKDPKVKRDAYRYRSMGQVPKAIDNFVAYLRISPQDYIAALDLGELYMRVEQFGEACKVYAKILEYKPKDAVAASNLGGALLRAGRAEDAKALLLYALELDPKNVHARINLGGVYQALGDRKANLDNALEAVSLMPSSALAFNNLGSALSDLAMFKEAKHAYETAVMLEPNQVDALINLAGTESRLGNPARAEEMYERVLALLPAQEKMRADAVKFYAAFECLKQGKLQKGWDYYDGGFSLLVPLAGARSPRRSFDIPRWEGKPLDGKTLLVWREQGLGDELLFYTCLHELKDMGGQVIVECDKRLVEVLARSFPEFTIRPEAFLAQHEGKAVHADFDFHIPAGSLMKYFRPTKESFTRSGAYVVPNDEHVADFTQRLAPYREDTRLVGICWRSGKLDPVRNLSYTTIDEWAPLLQMPGYTFVNLQYGECEAELQAIEQKLNIKILRWPDLDLKNDLDRVFSLMHCLDAVASVQTAVLTMAGSAGVPVVGIKAGGWTALGALDRSVWFDSYAYSQDLASTSDLLREFYIDQLLRGESLECCCVRRIEKVISQINRIPANCSAVARKQELSSETARALVLRSLAFGVISEADAITLAENCLHEAEKRASVSLADVTTAAFKLMLVGYGDLAHKIALKVLSANDVITPIARKDLAVMLAYGGELGLAQAQVRKAYDSSPHVKNGFSEIAEILFDRDGPYEAKQWFLLDQDDRRQDTDKLNMSFVYACVYSGDLDKALEYLQTQRKNFQKLKPVNPYTNIALALWHLSGFKDFPDEFAALDIREQVSSWDIGFHKALKLRTVGDIKSSEKSLGGSSYRGASLMALIWIDRFLAAESQERSLSDLYIKQNLATQEAHPILLSYIGRDEEAHRLINYIYSNDRMLSRNHRLLCSLLSNRKKHQNFFVNEALPTGSGRIFDRYRLTWMTALAQKKSIGSDNARRCD